MYEQLGKVLAMIQDKQVDLRVVPFENGMSVAQDSNFVLLQFDDLTQQPVVYVEGLAAYQLHEERQLVGRYKEEIGRLKETALDLGRSAELIERARDSYRDH